MQFGFQAVDAEGFADEMEAYVFTLIRPDVDWKL